jgi:hypothetical protein
MSERRATAAIHVWDNGRGLTRDLHVITELVEQAGFVVSIEPTRPHERGVFYRAHARRMVRRPVRDVNLFLERLVPSQFHLARGNVLIPNQEWFPARDLRLLPFLDAIACRSHLAERLFAGRAPRVEYIGFTSIDRHLPDVPRKDRILHIAGHSRFKGTAALLRVWQRHPEWPLLTVVHRAEVAPLVEGAANIQQLVDFVPDDQLRRLQQEAWLHIQPSEAEGFGHCLCEGMSAGALVMTVDAAPMNELIAPGRGILVPAGGVEPMGIDRRHFVAEPALEAVLTETLRSGCNTFQSKMTAAQAWFEANDQRFRREFPVFMATFLG